MIEEEKNAIEYYKDYAEILNNELILYGHIKTLKVDYKKLKTLVNLIQKQDTEINKLKQENEQLKSELGYTRKLNYTGNHIPRIDKEENMDLEKIINDLCKTFCKCCNMCESLLFGDNEIEYSDLRETIDEWNEKALKYLGDGK